MITPVQWIWQPQMPLPLERFRLKGNLSYVSPSCATDCNRTGNAMGEQRKDPRCNNLVTFATTALLHSERIHVGSKELD